MHPPSSNDRPLTDGEIKLARTMFGDTIDYARTGVANRNGSSSSPGER